MPVKKPAVKEPVATRPNEQSVIPFRVISSCHFRHTFRRVIFYALLDLKFMNAYGKQRFQNIFMIQNRNVKQFVNLGAANW